MQKSLHKFTTKFKRKSYKINCFEDILYVTSVSEYRARKTYCDWFFPMVDGRYIEVTEMTDADILFDMLAHPNSRDMRCTK
jgi:hypothetical protein